MDDDELLCPHCGEVIEDFEIRISRDVTQYGSYIGNPAGDVYDWETEEEEFRELNVDRIICCRCSSEIFDPLYTVLLDRVRDNL